MGWQGCPALPAHPLRSRCCPGFSCCLKVSIHPARFSAWRGWCSGGHWCCAISREEAHPQSWRALLWFPKTLRWLKWKRETCRGCKGKAAAHSRSCAWHYPCCSAKLRRQHCPPPLLEGAVALARAPSIVWTFSSTQSCLLQEP